MTAQPTLRAWLESEPYTLCMSAGFFGFFAHCGMLTVLEDEDLLPTRVVGASAGGLVAGCWASGLDAPKLEHELIALKREDFWDPWPGVGLLRGRKFESRLDDLLPNKTFNRCRSALAVSVFDVMTRKTVVIDHGEVNQAVRATAALPFLFHPVWIDRRPLMDGGILDRPGHAGLAAGERVFFHHLPSKSPWRRQDSPVLEIPRKKNMTTLAISGLPRVNPFALERGHAAMMKAREATIRALEMPIERGATLLDAL